MAKKLFLLMVLVLIAAPALAHVDTAWVRRYDGPVHYTDHPFDIATDDSGYVCVTGTSRGSGTYFDYATIRYEPDGDTAWLRRYDGPALDSSDVARVVVVDASRYVYVTGYGDRASGGNETGEYTTIKYEPDGDTAWVRYYNGPWTGFDDAYDLVVDDSGYVYVTGESQADTSPGFYPGDWATVKYNSDGGTVWVRRWPDSTLDNRAFAIGVDDSGYVCVAGGSDRAETWADIIVIRYYPNGDTDWLREYDGPASAGDIPAYGGIAVDGSGNIYVAGRRDGGEIGTGDYVTIKYYPDGDTAWVRGYDGPGNGADYAQAIAVDGSGNVYVTGFSDGGVETGLDYATIKYQSNGDTAWIRRYDGPAENGTDSATALVVDEGGNVYVTGTSNVDSAQGQDCVTLRYNPDGTIAWIETYNGPDSAYDGGVAIALKDSNNVYVAAYSWGDSSDLDYVTINYVQFLCGDANGDGEVKLGDLVYLLNYVYKQGPPPDPMQAGDVNMDGIVELGDIVYMQNYLYKSGPEPCAEE